MNTESNLGDQHDAAMDSMRRFQKSMDIETPTKSPRRHMVRTIKIKVSIPVDASEEVLKRLLNATSTFAAMTLPDKDMVEIEVGGSEGTLGQLMAEEEEAGCGCTGTFHREGCTRRVF